MQSRIRATALTLTLASTLVSCQNRDLRTSPTSIAEAGFSVPESAIHDVSSDVYLVSNINGSPFGDDGKGFISRVSPSGEVLELKWIDGEADGTTLNAPKGMAIVDDTLYVADVTSVRMFDTSTGKSLGSISIAGTTFLNDLAAASDGVVYVSDSGFAPGFEPSGTDAVYAIYPGSKPRKIASGEALAGPNGLLVAGDRLLVVNWGGGSLQRVEEDGSLTKIVDLPKNQLDGIVEDANGDFLISSWAGKCVYRVDSTGEISTAVSDLEAPADIAWDATRQCLILPWFTSARVDLLPAP